MTPTYRYLKGLDNLMAVVKERRRLSAGAESPEADFFRAALAMVKSEREYVVDMEDRVGRLELWSSR